MNAFIFLILLLFINSSLAASCDDNYITQNENECKTLNPAFGKEYCCHEKYTGGEGGTRYLCIPLNEDEYLNLDPDYNGSLDTSEDPETQFEILYCDFSVPKKNQDKKEENNDKEDGNKSTKSNSNYLLNNLFILLLLSIINY